MEEGLYAVRFLHYAVTLQLFGVACFQAVMAPPSLREALQRPSRNLAAASAILILLSGLAWLMLMAGSMGSGWEDVVDPGVIATVLTATGFGEIWLLRLLLALVVLLVAIVVRGHAGWLLLTMLSALALGSLGLVGHAAVDSGLVGLLHETSQILHLLGSGFWLGSLVPLLFCIVALRNPRLTADADLALRRFSGLGHFAVAIALGTGVANTWFILRTAEVNAASPYQGLLLVKVLLVGVMIVLAIFNRYVFVPRIPDNGPGLDELRRGTIAEIALGAGVVALVSVLGVLPPS